MVAIAGDLWRARGDAKNNDVNVVLPLWGFARGKLEIVGLSKEVRTHTHVYSTKTLKSVKWPSVHFLGDSYSLWVFWIKYPVGLLLDNFIMRLFVGLGVGW